MAQFCDCGADQYLCQKCGRIRCSAEEPSEWRTDITKNLNAGNVCPSCVKLHEAFTAPLGPPANSHKKFEKPAGRMLRPVIDEEIAKEIEKGREYEKSLMKPEVEDKKPGLRVDETLKKILGDEPAAIENWRNVKRVSSSRNLPKGYTKIHATPIKETEKAILFSRPQKYSPPIASWLPKSQLYILTGDHIGLDLTSFYGPLWLLRKSGL